MSITVGDNFSYQGGKPLDARFQFSSVANMKAFAEASLYDGCLAYIPSLKKYYTYDSSNTVDTTTGRWRELETGGGGGGTSDYNDLTNKPQIASVTLTGNTSLATLGLTSSVETQFSGSSTKSYVTRDEKYNWNTCGTVIGNCTTSGSTSAKSVDIYNGVFNFTQGARIAIKFWYANTASAPTLTVNNTTKNIKCIDENGSAYTPVIWWDANDIVEFVYDGTQFLMQPTISMMFKIHGTTMDREAIYSTSEKVVGCWTDGRPVYQKTISCGALPNATSKTINHGISNMNNIVDAKGVFWNSSKSGGALSFAWPITTGNPDNTVGLSVTASQIYIGTKSDMSQYSTCYVTLQYTKTTDSANSFKYADPNDYSTTEKIVGTWIDGSTLYQKTINFGALPNATTKRVDHNISNISKVVFFKGWFANSDNSTWAYIPYASGTENNTVEAWATSSQIAVRTFKDQSNFTTCYITINYTKS